MRRPASPSISERKRLGVHEIEWRVALLRWYARRMTTVLGCEGREGQEVRATQAPAPTASDASAWLKDASSQHSTEFASGGQRCTLA